MLAILVQVLFWLIPTLDIDLLGNWDAYWIHAPSGRIAWDGLHAWLLVLPGTALACGLLLLLPAGRLRGLLLVLVTALALLLLAQDGERMLSLQLTADLTGWPQGDATMALCLVLAFTLLAIGVTYAPVAVRLLVAAAGFSLLATLVLWPHMLDLSLGFDAFTAPIRESWNAQVIDIGVHSRWYVGVQLPGQEGIPLRSSWVQLVAKGLQIVGVVIQLVSLVAAFFTALLGLTRHRCASLALLPLGAALFGTLLVVVSGFFWGWAIPGADILPCLAGTLNHLKVATQALSAFALFPLSLAALLCPR